MSDVKKRGLGRGLGALLPGGPMATPPPRPVGTNAVSVMATGSMTDTPSRFWLATKKRPPSGESRTSMGSPPTW